MRQGLDDEFRRLLNDLLLLRKPDGRVYPEVKAYVSPKGILITDVSLPIEVGDEFSRMMPSGITEAFIVDDPGYRASMLGSPPHFQVRVHRMPSGPKPPSGAHQNKQPALLQSRPETNLMYIIAKKALTFLKDGYTSDQVTVKPINGPQAVPDWVRESLTFRHAVTDGSVTEVAITTPLPDAAALSPGREFPRFVYHATKEPTMVSSAQEEAELGPGWSRTYIHQDYPKAKYHWTKPSVTVQSAEEEKALGGGWGDAADFTPYKGPRPAREDRQDPEKWVDEWSVPGLTSDHRRMLRAQLLRADSAFWKAPDGSAADVDSMRIAFKGIAQVLFDAGILTEQLLQNETVQLIWDSAIAGGWWRFASETRENIFPERVGHYWAWRDESRDWQVLFRAEIAEFRAKLLEVPAPGAVTPTRFEGTTRGKTTQMASWQDLRNRFESYAAQYADRAERDAPQDWAHLPPGEWALRGGSPRSDRIFKQIAALASAKLGASGNPDNVEAWKTWLDFMWTEGWYRPEAISSSLGATPPRQVRWREIKRMAEQAGRIQRIDLIFQTSADCCQECADRETDQKTLPVAESGPEPNDDEEVSETENDPDPEQAARARTRSAWLNQRLAQHPVWSSDVDIGSHGGPSYNTIRRYRRGIPSTRDLSVRKGIATAFQCEVSEVPE